MVAPPGAGKTTRVPRAIYDAGLAGGEILVLQPRRLATRLSALRVAAEFGEKAGQTVGFAMRFESVGGPATRIRFVTEGVLARRIIQDPVLSGVSVVILDEFHERHIATDLAMALLRDIQRHARPDLKILVMSATMNPAPVASFLGEATVITCEGVCYPVDVEFEARIDSNKLQQKVASAVVRLLREKPDGDILAFLPGAAEIRRAMETLAPIAGQSNLSVVPLHGSLPPSQQSLAVEPGPRRKVILATNVAETSITVPGIAAVVDSGLARLAVHSSWTGIPSLRLAKISRASAEQRAGRAGRNRAGKVIRLYTRADYESRPEYDLPEIRRSDLAETLLTLHGAGIPDARCFSWFEPPPEAALQAAEELLHALEALDEQGRLTSVGRSMLRFPVHPRLARLIVEGERMNVADDAACLAALLSERDIRLETRFGTGPPGNRSAAGQLGLSDPLELLSRYRKTLEIESDRGSLRAAGLDPDSVDRVRRAHRQLKKIRPGHERDGRTGESSEESLRIAILTAFPDRVAKRRSAGSRDLLLSVGGTARLAESSGAHDAPLLVAVDIEERRELEIRKGACDTIVRLASAIEPEWLAAVCPTRLRQENELLWNEEASRVDQAKRTCYDQITLEEMIQPAAPSSRASELLAEKILARDLEIFRDRPSLADLQVRLAMLARQFPSEGFPEFGQDELKATILEICEGKRAFSEIRGVSLAERILSRLTARNRDLLTRMLPERILLSQKRSLKIHYEAGQPPWVESRLQDFFGMKKTPAICGGKVPLTVRLLAPNGRPVQITSDLEGFWKRHYPDVRRELRRRYPKHAWPSPDEI